jgi:hypothetical protein
MQATPTNPLGIARETAHMFNIWPYSGLGVEVVYFLRRESDQCIKIGCTGIISRRVARITRDIGEPVTVLAACPGYRDEEWALHDHLQATRVDGEWFHPTPQLLAFIDWLHYRGTVVHHVYH